MPACSCSSAAAITQTFNVFWQPRSLTWSSYSDHTLSTLAPWDSIPSTAPFTPSFDTFAQASDLWATSDLSFADTDWNLVSLDPSTAYPSVLNGVDATVSEMSYAIPPIPPTFPALSDSDSNDPQPFLSTSMATSSANSQDGHSYESPTSQIPDSISPSRCSPATSQGDDAPGRVDSSRVEKRRLNTLAARRCRQRRVDRMKTLEDELESIRRERDELRLRVSKLEGETEAMRGLLSRKSS
ncbi:bZIP transcription factor bZIP-1 [Penicillium capsulatum]|nr:bZIP transcription factor bZIP-1 [Penicillium capsulatum]